LVLILAKRRCHQGKGNNTIDNKNTKDSLAKHGGKQCSCTISDSTSKRIRGCTATHRQPRPRAGREEAPRHRSRTAAWKRRS